MKKLVVFRVGPALWTYLFTITLNEQDGSKRVQVTFRR